MGAVIFIFVLASVFLMLSIFLFCGKGSWLISGYNTMSNEEKKRYDKKKLCKGTGMVTLVVSSLLYIMTYLAYKVELGTMSENQMFPFAVIFILVIFTAVGLNIYYTNKKCKNKR